MIIELAGITDITASRPAGDPDGRFVSVGWQVDFAPGIITILNAGQDAYRICDRRIHSVVGATTAGDEVVARPGHRGLLPRNLLLAGRS